MELWRANLDTIKVKDLKGFVREAKRYNPLFDCVVEQIVGTLDESNLIFFLKELKKAYNWREGDGDICGFSGELKPFFYKNHKKIANYIIQYEGIVYFVKELCGVESFIKEWLQRDGLIFETNTRKFSLYALDVVARDVLEADKEWDKCLEWEERE